MSMRSVSSTRPRSGDGDTSPKRSQGDETRWIHLVQSSDGKTDEVFISRIDDAWAYQMRVARQNGGWVVAELRVFPFAAISQLCAAQETIDDWDGFVPQGGLTARHLRRIPFRGGPISGLRQLDSCCDELARTYRERQRLAAELKRWRRTRTRFISTYTRRAEAAQRLARIAASYVQVRKMGSRRSNAEVARLLGLRVNQVRDAIHVARRKGLLSPTLKQGSAGGELTPRALDLLKADNAFATTARQIIDSTVQKIRAEMRGKAKTRQNYGGF